MGEILFGRYEVLKKLGEGGFGNVMLARDLNLGLPVAVKVMGAPENAGRELTLLKELKHEGLPTVYDHRILDGKGYLIMEYVEGVPLDLYLKKQGRMPPEKAVRVMEQLSGILGYLHGSGAGIIYRDLKPSNIMLTPEEKVRLIDLGASLRVDPSPDGERDLYGTPGYTAPELFAGERAEISSDIYSLGAVFYELLTGERAMKTRTYEKDLPKELIRIIERCLDPDKRKRYRNTAELQKDLRYRMRIGECDRVYSLLRIVTVVSAFLTAGVTGYLSLRGGIGFRIPVTLLAVSILLSILLKSPKPEKDYLFSPEKDIFLTDKKNTAILCAVFLLLGASASFVIFDLRSAGAEDPGTTAYRDAAENDELWVEIKDPSERKVLLGKESAYDVSDRLRFEIPAEDLPSEDMRIRIIAEDDGGNTFMSRDFRVKK